MSKSDEIAKLDRAVKDAEIRLRTLVTNVDALTKEIDVLSNQEKVLDDNVKCLKKNKIIAIAQEFKKSKEELAKVRSRITFLTNDRDYYVKSSNDIKDFIKETNKSIEILKSSNSNNVLQFRNKDGQG